MTPGGNVTGGGVVDDAGEVVLVVPGVAEVLGVPVNRLVVGTPGVLVLNNETFI